MRYGIMGLLAASLLAAVFLLGKASGISEVSAEWTEADERRHAIIQDIALDVAKKEATHLLESEKNSEALIKAKTDYEASLVKLRADLSDRLLVSEERAGLYKRKAQGTTSERDRLAEHATELDRSLEQGRSLVRELGQIVRQHEVTIRILGNQILRDRTLLTESSEPNGK
jgi:hypothetical protein